LPSGPFNGNPSCGKQSTCQQPSTARRVSTYLTKTTTKSNRPNGNSTAPSRRTAEVLSFSPSHQTSQSNPSNYPAALQSDHYNRRAGHRDSWSTSPRRSSDRPGLASHLGPRSSRRARRGRRSCGPRSRRRLCRAPPGRPVGSRCRCWGAGFAV
jgi:hypothetical protein